MDPLSDPLKNRIVKHLKAPPHKPLDHNLLFPPSLGGSNYLIYLGKPDWKLLKDHLA